jgi:hypothetical protein
MVPRVPAGGKATSVTTPASVLIVEDDPDVALTIKEVTCSCR